MLLQPSLVYTIVVSLPPLLSGCFCRPPAVTAHSQEAINTTADDETLPWWFERACGRAALAPSQSQWPN